MGKTADFEQAIWSDPWFVSLPPDAKLLYVWGFTNEHSNLAGLFVVARPMIEMETGLKGKRLDAAIDAVCPKLLYHEESGALWVVGRAKHVRAKTTQIAKSIARAVSECPHTPFGAAFIQKYEVHPWLGRTLAEVHVNLTANGSVEPQDVTFSRTSPEVLSLRSKSKSKSIRSTASEEEQQTKDSRALAQLDEELRPLVAKVRERLLAVAEEKPGAVAPTVAAVARALGDNPRKDFLPAVGNFEHYWLHGKAAGQSLTDVVKAFRNWLSREPDVARRTSAVPIRNGARRDPEEMERRIREADL